MHPPEPFPPLSAAIATAPVSGPPNPRTSATPSSPPSRPGAPPHVLIVDDSGHDGWRWAGALRRAGFRVGLAADADAGWYALDGDTFSLLIVNQSPTGHTERELIHKARAAGDQLACVMIHDVPQLTRPTPITISPPSATLEKPLAIARLLAVVRKLLRPADAIPPPATAVGITPLVGAPG